MKIAYGTGITFLATMVGAVLLLATVAGPAKAGGTTWIVTTGVDSLSGVCPGVNCTLREALQEAQSGDSIHFNIPQSDPSYSNALGFWKIVILDQDLGGTPIGEVTVPITINGYTQLGASPNTLPFGQGSNAQIKIQVDFINHPGLFGFVLATSNATIRGLSITNAGIGVAVCCGTGNQVAGNFIGTDPRGNVPMGNGFGVTVTTDGFANTIGGSAPADRNVIVANDDGIMIADPGNMVQGNLIGLGADGSSHGNGAGVIVRNTFGTNFIGGGSAGQGNVISANAFYGVDLEADSFGTVVMGNYIGTNLSGTAARPNTSGGIFLEGPDNIVGGQTASARNIISGNGGPGIRSTNLRNIIEGNYIGTNAAGTAGIGNTQGVVIESADNVIGGTSAGQRNVISGNFNNGVHLSGVGASGTTVWGNYVGTNAAGTAAVANSTGIRIDSANNAAIGGMAAGAGNLLSGNFWGLFINSGNSNEVYGNRIGTNAAANGAISNTGEGILVNGNGNKIGGTDAAHANVIAFNNSDGVRITNGVGNPVLRNSIHSNGGIGINLGTDGFTFNDPGDGDNGPNRLQNYPVLQSIDEGTLVLQMLLNSAPFVEYRIEFFRSDDCDPTTYGEGQVFLTALNRVMPAGGVDNFQVNVDPDLGGAYITTTATNNTLEDTSEFSNCIQVPQGETPTPTPTQPGQTPTPTPSATPTPTATPPGQTPTPTPTPTVPGQTPTPTAPGQTSTPTASPDGLELLLGDVNCSGLVDPVDALGLLRADAGLSVNKVDPACPDIGDQVNVAAVAAVPEGETIPWGDVDCDLAVGPIDALKVLRHDAGLNVSQQFGCPDIGEPL